jgi:murein DD-endopeptidase MepM/ murein hydrolase activator NlpD
MSETEIEKRTLIDRLQDSYKIVIQDEEDLREINSFSVSLINFYVLISSLALIITIFTVSIIIFTPIKRWIPGYGELTSNREFLELQKRIQNLETELDAQEVYYEGLRNLLTGLQPDTDTDREAGIVQKERLKAQEVKESGVTGPLNNLLFASPLKGTITAEFDPTISHYGLDIIAPKNTVIKSIMDGRVISADWSLDAGNFVYIQHPKNIISVYKHNSAVLVKTGDIVRTGQAVAIIGDTGEQSTGPHLHLELWFDGTPVNPANYITFN